MSDYSEYFLNSSADIVQLELFEFTHPNFSRTYRVVRNKTDGFTATVDGASQIFQYYPLKVTPSSDKANLDHALKLEFGDLGEVLPSELDLIRAAGNLITKPAARYWIFRSDRPTVALFGPITLEIERISFTRQGASFEIKAPTVNNNRTGELYKLERFPLLRGFL